MLLPGASGLQPMHLHLVAAQALGFVERFVGGTHEGQEALWFGRRSDACAYRDLDRLFLQVELHCLHFTQDAFGQVLNDPDIKSRMVTQGADPAFLGSEEFGKFLAAETPRWAAAVKASGAKLD